MALIKLPQLNYVVFEAVRFPITTDDKGNETIGEPEQDKVLVLDRVYTSIKYSHAALNTNTKFFGEKYLTDKGGLAPVRIEIKGTFGYEAIRRGLAVRTGFERFKEFRDELFNKVQSISETLEENTLPTSKRYVYSLNFYDMINHFWGEVDIKEFLSSSDANVHSRLQMYEINMLGLNHSIAVTSKDFLVTLIRQQIELQKIQDELEKSISDLVKELAEENEDFKKLVEALGAAGSFLTGAVQAFDFAREYVNQAEQMNNIYNSMLGGLSIPLNPLGTLISAGKSFIPILN